MKNDSDRINILNKKIKECNRCSLSSGRIHTVYGEGNINARLFFIAQAPGETEDKEGKMFIGPTGRVIDELFEMINIKREEIYMTNLIKCRLTKNRKPGPTETEMCSKFLVQEIEIIKPEFLIPLGYHATKFILSRYCNEKYLSTENTGKLIYCKGQKIYPLRHPSAVLYNPSFMQEMIKNFKKISVFKEICKWFPLCPIKKFVEERNLNKDWIELYCKGDWESCKRYQMEEKGQYHPDNMLPDGTINNELI